MSKRNVLTEPSILVDDVLSMLTGHPRGTLVSYTEITKSATSDAGRFAPK